MVIEESFTLKTALPQQQARVAGAVDDLLFRFVDIQQAKQRRVQIDRADDGVTGGAGGSLARPANHQRHALATFIDAAFAFPEWRVVGGGEVTCPVTPVGEHGVL